MEARPQRRLHALARGRHNGARALIVRDNLGMTLLKFSRITAIAIGIYAALSTIGGLVLGFAVQNGTYIAVGCLMAGVALSCSLWWLFTREKELSVWDVIGRIGFAGSAGLALYSNLAWGLWALGVPMDLGTVREGRMGENYWLGPATLAYAVFCYATIRWPSKKTGQKEGQ